MALPIVHGLEKEYGDRIEFVRVNILHPESAALMERFSFSATPEFYLVDGSGKIIAVWDDTIEAEAVRAVFDQALQTAD
jgi:hypothetical protein